MTKCNRCVYGQACLNTWTTTPDRIHNIQEFFRYCEIFCGVYKQKDDESSQRPNFDDIEENW